MTVAQQAHYCKNHAVSYPGLPLPAARLVIECIQEQVDAMRPRTRADARGRRSGAGAGRGPAA